SIVATVGWYNGKTVSGIVSQVNAKDSTGNNNKSHSLNIKYEINGVQHEHRVNPVRQQPMHEVGDNIKLLLFNGNASLKTVWEQFGLSIFLGITGALCLMLWRGLKALGV